MTSFTNSFSGSAVQPTDVAYRAFSMEVNTQLLWPVFSGGNPNVAARFMDVNVAAAGLTLTMPDATLASIGQDNIINNVGTYTLTLASYAGATIASVAPGTQWYVLINNNSYQGGGWDVLQFGTGTSQAQASSLAGLGLSAIGGLLNLNYNVITASTDFAVTVANRATLFVWTGGSGVATLPDAVAVGSGYVVAFANNGSGGLAITPVDGQQIDEVSTSTFSQTQSGFVVSSGSGWNTLGKGLQTNFAVTLLNKNVAGSSDVTLTSSEAQNIIQQYTGVLSGNINVIVPDTVQLYYVFNNTSGAFALVVKTAAGTGIGVQQGGRSILYCDGTNVVNAFSFVPSGAQQFPAGSALSPSLSFQNGPSSGFFSPSANIVGVTANGFETMRWASQASAVNDLLVTASATGAAPSIVAMGNDTDINLSLSGQGTGGILIPAGALATPSLLLGEATTGLYLSSTGHPALSALAQFVMGWSAQASTVNGFAVQSTATGNAPNLSVLGTDTNINMQLIAQGTGGILIPAGLVATPGLLVGETTTGLWLPSTGIVGVSVAGVEAARFTSSFFGITPGILLETNNTFIQQKDSGATSRDIMGLDGSNILQMGGTGISSIKLNNNTNATTQTLGDSSTLVATDNFVMGVVQGSYALNIITASGNFTTASNSSTSTIYKYTVVGGGGGGAGGAATNDQGSGGGGAGATVIGTFTGVPPSTVISVVVGTGGTGGNSSGGNGSNGIASSIGTPVTVTSNPGFGSIGGNGFPGGAGGAASSVVNALNIGGGAGGSPGDFDANGIGGNGGSSIYGGGGNGGSSVHGIVAQNGIAPGAGGGGGGPTGGGSPVGQAGGAGAAGIVIIERITF